MSTSVGSTPSSPQAIVPPPPGGDQLLASFLRLSVRTTRDEVVTGGATASVASALRQEQLQQAKREQADAASRLASALASASRAHFIGSIVTVVCTVAAVVAAVFTAGAALAALGVVAAAGLASAAGSALGLCAGAVALAKLGGTAADTLATDDALDSADATLRVAATERDAEASQEVVKAEGESLATTIAARGRSLEAAESMLSTHGAAAARAITEGMTP